MAILKQHVKFMWIKDDPLKPCSIEVIAEYDSETKQIIGYVCPAGTDIALFFEWLKIQSDPKAVHPVLGYEDIDKDKL
jgi:hypothetical protein